MIDKQSGMFSFSCSPEALAAGTCHPTRDRTFKMPVFAHRFAPGGMPEPPEMERINLDAATLEKLLEPSTVGPNVKKIVTSQE